MPTDIPQPALQLRSTAKASGEVELSLASIPVPQPAADEVLLRVHACGVCRTDLHIVDGELPEPRLPRVPGHEIVGVILACGVDVKRFTVGDRIGVPWLGGTCRVCPFCRTRRENLCDAPEFTGYTRDGGYATHTLADARYCFPLQERKDDAEIAPFLCAGLIGWRSYRMAGAEGAGSAGVEALGLYGFGAAAHILAQVAAWQGRRVYAFTRSGDTAAQAFARSLGAVWAGGSDEMPPEPLEYQGPAAIAGFLSTVPAGGRLDQFRLIPTRANGQPAFGCYMRDPRAPIAHAYGLMVLTLDGDRIAAITGFPDTSVFPHFGLPRTLRDG